MPVKRSTSGAAAAPATSARPAQRRRTRKAIVEAAMALITRGETPTVNDVAAAADVSRRTVYLYFPAFDQLLIDATLGVLSQAPVNRAIHASSSGDDLDDLDDRVERLVRALQHVSPEVERLGRALIRLTVDGETDGGKFPRRGYRRVEWIETALEPLRRQVSRAAFSRLVSALAMIVGWEALITQRDVCGLSVAEGEELSVWSARALLRATLDEARATRTVRESSARAGRIR